MDLMRRKRLDTLGSTMPFGVARALVPPA